jgi:glycosyltransferase involved in cell wall biosynthesis
VAKKLKIGFDAKRIFHNTSGLGNYARTLVSNLKRYYPENEYYLFTPKMPEKYNEQIAPFVDDNIISNNGILMPNSVWRSWGCSKSINNLNLDIYHGLSQEIPFGIHPSTKTFVTIHDLLFERLPKLFNPIDSKLYSWKYQSSCNRADKIIAISQSTKNDIDYFYNIKDNVEVVYQGINDIYFEEDTYIYNSNRDYYLFVSTINERKGLIDLVRAYDLMSMSDRVPIHVIGGSSNYTKVVKKEIEKLGLQEWFIFLGFRSDEELKKKYGEAKALIFPSIYEGFGLPIVEALSQGCIVVSTDVSSMPEAAGPHALYVKPNDPKSIAIALTQLARKTALSIETIKEVQKYVFDKFNSEELTHQLMQLYRTEVNRR